MMSFVATLLGTKLGRYIVLGGIIVLLSGIVVLRIYNAGRKSEKLKQTQKTLEVLRTKIGVDDEISNLSPADRLDRLNRWVRDE